MRWPWQSREPQGVYGGLRTVPETSQIEREQIGGDKVFTSYTWGQGGPQEAIPAAKCAVDLLTWQMCLLQPRVYNAKDEPIEGGQTNALLMNPSMTLDRWQTWSMMWRSHHGFGNGYLWIRRNGGGIAELVPAICTNSRLEGPLNNRRVLYTLQLYGDGVTGSQGMSITAMQKDVIAFHGSGFNGLASPSPIAHAAQNAVKMMENVVKHQNKLTEGMLSAGSVIQVSKEGMWNVSDKQIKDFKRVVQLINESVKEAKKGGFLPTMPPGVTIERMQTLTNQDLELIELLKWGVHEMARVWHVPPAKLMEYYRGYRVTEMEIRGAEFERYSIAPHVAMAEAQFTSKLVSSKDRGQGIKIKIPTDSLKRGTLSERIEAAKMGVSDGGIMTPNEGRELIGLPPIPGEDKLLMPKGAPYQNDGGNNAQTS